jgi:hypothetical protein
MPSINYKDILPQTDPANFFNPGNPQIGWTGHGTKRVKGL